MNTPKKPKLDNAPSRNFFYRHILRALHDEGGKAKSSSVCEKIINSFDIPDEVRQRKFACGNNILINTINWARHKLVQDGYLAPPTERGIWELSEKGKDAVRVLDEGGSPELRKFFGDEGEAYPEVRRRERQANLPEREKPEIRMPASPSHNFFFRPLLESLYEEGGKASCAALYSKITSRFDIPDDIKKREFSGENNVLRSAKQDLVDNGYLLPSPEREIWEISEKGKVAIREFQEGGSAETREFFGINDEWCAESTEAIEKPAPGTYEKAEREQHDLGLIRTMEAHKFERLCGLLLKAAGYTDIEITPMTKDGGYDGFGFVSLGLVKSKIAFQSKRYAEDRLIPVNDIRAFSAVIRNVNAAQGVFFTTSDFSQSAINEADTHGIRLINGEKFLELLYDHQVCCTVRIDKNALDNV